MPVGLSRGFRIAGNETALLLAIVGGTDPSGVRWRDDVMAEASRRGHGLDDDGQIIETSSAAE